MKTASDYQHQKHLLDKLYFLELQQLLNERYFIRGQSLIVEFQAGFLTNGQIMLYSVLPSEHLSFIIVPASLRGLTPSDGQYSSILIVIRNTLHFYCY